jgi:hypothetical protein
MAVVADAALSATGLTISGTEGTSVANPVVATFTDADTTNTATDRPSDTSSYSATVQWTDSNGTHTVAGTIVFVGPGRTYNVTLSGNVALTAGNYPLSVTIHDAGGASTTATATAAITDAALSGSGTTLTAVEGQGTGSVQVGQFTDSDSSSDPTTAASNYTATISYTDAGGTAHTVSGTVVFSGTDHTFNVLNTTGFTFGEEGNYTLNILVLDKGGGSVPITSQVAVSDAPLSLVGTPPSLGTTEGSLLTNVQLATFTDSDVTPRDASQYSATITWDDGLGQSHTSAGRISPVAGSTNTFAVFGDNSLPYLQGTHNITIQISDVGGATTSSVATVTVSPGSQSAAGTALAANEGQTFTAIIGSYQNLSQPGRAAAGNSVQVDWGDGTTSAGTVTLTSAGNMAVSGSHSYHEEGDYGITFTVTAAGGSNTVTAHSTVHVLDAPLVMGAMTPPTIVLVGQLLNAIPVATFTDTNSFHSGSAYSAQINWGDGAVTVGTIEDNGNGTFTVLGTHAYGQIGRVTMTVTVQDTGGASASGSAAVPAATGGSATPLFLADSQSPAPSWMSWETALFQLWQMFIAQELEMFFGLTPAQVAAMGL